jgi:hypothetical protein
MNHITHTFTLSHFHTFTLSPHHPIIISSIHSNPPYEQTNQILSWDIQRKTDYSDGETDCNPLWDMYTGFVESDVHTDTLCSWKDRPSDTSSEAASET